MARQLRVEKELEVQTHLQSRHEQLRLGIWNYPKAGYLSKAENIIFIGNPGLGKSHIATGLALAACRQEGALIFQAP